MILELIEVTVITNDLNSNLLYSCRFAGYDSVEDLKEGLTNNHFGTRLMNEREAVVGRKFKNGDIDQLETTPYPIKGIMVKKCSGVVLGTNEKMVVIINASLARHRACVILNGKPTVEFAPLAPTAAVAEQIVVPVAEKA